MHFIQANCERASSSNLVGSTYWVRRDGQCAIAYAPSFSTYSKRSGAVKTVAAIIVSLAGDKDIHASELRFVIVPSSIGLLVLPDVLGQLSLRADMHYALAKHLLDGMGHMYGMDPPNKHVIFAEHVAKRLREHEPAKDSIWKNPDPEGITERWKTPYGLSVRVCDMSNDYLTCASSADIQRIFYAMAKINAIRHPVDLSGSIVRYELPPSTGEALRRGISTGADAELKELRARRVIDDG